MRGELLGALAAVNGFSIELDRGSFRGCENAWTVSAIGPGSLNSGPIRKAHPDFDHVLVDQPPDHLAVFQRERCFVATDFENATRA